MLDSIHLYTAIFGPPVTLVHRSLHVAMMCSMCFLMYPMRKKSSRTQPNWFDWLLAAISFVIPFYIWHDYLGVVERAGRASDMDMVMATLLVALVLEATRRCSGKALPILSLCFILYGMYGREFPGMFMHRGYDWLSLSNHFFANTEGIYGTSVNVSSSYIFLFILFVLSPQLMLINTTLGEGLFTAATAALGVFLLAVACEGYVYAPVNVVMRIVSLAGALLLMIPGIQTDIVGAVILIGVILFQKRKAKTLQVA